MSRGDETRTPLSHDAGITRLAQAFSESRVEFRALAESMPQLVWTATPSGEMVYFNRMWQHYTGLTIEQTREAGQRGVVHPDDLQRTLDLWQRAVGLREPFEVEYRLRNAADLTYRWFLAHAVPVFNEAGEVLRWVGTATDIDAHRRSDDNLRFVLDASMELGNVRDRTAICERLAAIAIEHFADGCIIVMKDGAALRAPAIAHRDPERIPYVEAYRDRFSVDPNGDAALAIRTNSSVLTPSAGDGSREAAAGEPEHLDVLQSLRLYSVMAVPLSPPGGAPLGAAVLFSSESQRRYDRRDLEVAELVGRRAGAALQNARAFEDERRTSKRLRFIANASEVLFEGFDVQMAFESLVKLAVRNVADVAQVLRCGNDGAMRVVAIASSKSEHASVTARLLGERTLRPEGEMALFERLRRGTTYASGEKALRATRAHLWDYLVNDVAALGLTSSITVPLASRGFVYGAIVFFTTAQGRPFDERDLSMMVDLGRRASIAIDQAETFKRERRIATSLQRALLPRVDMLPRVPGIRFHTAYRPSSTEADIGGDWFDAIKLIDGSIVISIGDVTGRGLEAAGLMGKLRQSLGVVPMYEDDPSRILDAVDLILRRRGTSAIATAFVGIISPDRRRIRFANAGHPHPIVKCADSLVELAAEGLPLGLRDYGSGETREMAIGEADMIVLYTDGLTESTHDLLAGEARLDSVLRSDAIKFASDPAQMLCDACLPPNAPDDTAVLTISFSLLRHWAFDAEDARAAQDARGEFVAYITEHAPDGDIDAAELIFGELISNVVRHAPGPIDVQVEWSQEYATLHVTDRGRGFDRAPELPEDPMRESGRGLYIVDALARQCRVEYVPGYGTHIAVELPVTRSAHIRAT
ncbi:MAG TPA: SpoIIE family protein phosphatase [Candidatus Baltobacteraceae bacterium]|jgi:PAS domain S-box-containing protein|nr:SpoIIE family protein phosphatase [Candidatus Baltobacteraceae bacterium]